MCALRNQEVGTRTIELASNSLTDGREVWRADHQRRFFQNVWTEEELVQEPASVFCVPDCCVDSITSSYTLAKDRVCGMNVYWYLLARLSRVGSCNDVLPSVSYVLLVCPSHQR